MFCNRYLFWMVRNILPVACDITMRKWRNERTVFKFHILKGSHRQPHCCVLVLYPINYNTQKVLIFVTAIKNFKPIELIIKTAIIVYVSLIWGIYWHLFNITKSYMKCIIGNFNLNLIIILYLNLKSTDIYYYCFSIQQSVEYFDLNHSIKN